MWKKCQTCGDEVFFDATPSQHTADTLWKDTLKPYLLKTLTPEQLFDLKQKVYGHVGL